MVSTEGVVGGDGWPYNLHPYPHPTHTRSHHSHTVVTFLIQAAGGGLSASGTQKTSEVGGNIFLAGLALQLLSFFLFTCLWAVFLFRV
jgi:hypothetical protein